MADSILKIRTQDGDKPIGYPGLVDKPVANKELDTEGAFADAKAVGDKFKEVKAETNSLKKDLSFLKENGVPTSAIEKAVSDYFAAHPSSCLTESQVRAIVTSYGYTSVTDSYINSLIDAKLGVIENGTY